MSTFSVKDDGYLRLELKAADESPPITVRLDLFRTQAKFVEFQHQPEAQSEAESTRLMLDQTVSYLQSLGLPEMSHAAAIQIRTEVFRLTGTLRKKEEPAPPNSESHG